jgi:TIR domain
MAAGAQLLDKKTRLRLTFQIIDTFDANSMSFDSMNLVLRTYGFDVLEEYEGASLHDIVGRGTDEQLIELAEYFDLDVPETAAPAAQVSTVASAARPLFIFGSHLGKHRVLVGTVRQELLLYGIELFVAHDTIEEDTLWRDEIEKGLDRADAGVVFVHKDLRASEWCDQEIGWLLGRRVAVMALRFDEVPYGFFAKHQAQPVPINSTPTAIAEMLVDRIASKPELALGFAASLVAAMSSSPRFSVTDAIWHRLRELSTLDADLCSQLLEATKTNTQIHWANSALDNGEPYKRVICDFLRRQPGAAVIASDINAYESFLNEEDAEAERREEESNRRMQERMAAGEPPF